MNFSSNFLVPPFVNSDLDVDSIDSDLDDVNSDLDDIDVHSSRDSETEWESEDEGLNLCSCRYSDKILDLEVEISEAEDESGIELSASCMSHIIELINWKTYVRYYDYYVQSTSADHVKQSFPYVKVVLSDLLPNE